MRRMSLKTSYKTPRIAPSASASMRGPFFLMIEPFLGFATYLRGSSISEEMA